MTLPRNQQHRHAVGKSFQQPGGGVGGARSRHRERHTHVTGCAGKAVRHHGGRIFMAHQIVIQASRAAAEKRIIDLKVLDAGHSKHTTNSLDFQTFYQKICAFHGHASSAYIFKSLWTNQARN